MKLCIGVVGEIGSGKGTFSKEVIDLLDSSNCSYHRFSDVLRETADLWSIPQTRENLQKMAVVMDQGFGKGSLSQAIKQRILNDPKPIAVIDGVRWNSDEELIRSMPENFIVAITSPLEVRWQRIKEREENQDEKQTTLKQFQKESQAENEVHIKEIAKRADEVIENAGSLEEFRSAIKELVDGQIKPKILNL